MDHIPSLFLIDDLAHPDWHACTGTAISESPHHFAIGAYFLPFAIGEIPWRVTGCLDAFAIFAMAGDTQSFAKINLFASFDSFR